MVTRKSSAPKESFLDGVGQRYLERLFPSAGAALTFGLSLQAAQIAGRAFHVSCSTFGWSSALGCLAVASGSLAAGQVSFAVRKYLKHGPGKVEHFVISREDAAFAVITGIMAFKMFGGSFRNLMPSHVCEPGAVANFSIPANGPQFATSLQSSEIKRAFQRDGCHHCGRRSGESIADHIPPRMIMKTLQQKNRGFWLSRQFKFPQNVAQRFYPQCERCMKRQSAFLINGKDPFVYHLKGLPKPPFLTGFVLGAFTFDGASNKDAGQ